MKKILCLLMSLILLLSFVGCNKKEEKKSNKELIEELLVCETKTRVGFATEDEVRSTRTEAYWEFYEGRFEMSLNGTGASVDTGDQEQKSAKEMFLEEYGEDVEFTVEITEMEKFEIKEYDEERFKRLYPHLELKDVEASYMVAYTVTVKGSKKTDEMNGPSNTIVIKVDGNWYIA